MITIFRKYGVSFLRLLIELLFQGGFTTLWSVLRKISTWKAVNGAVFVYCDILFYYLFIFEINEFY